MGVGTVPQVINSSTSSFLLDDVYVQNILPQSTIQGASAQILGAVGTGSWGKPNVPMLCSSLSDVGTKIGLPGAAALADIHDLASDVALALGQGNGSNGVAVWAVRVTDGTDKQATGNLLTVSTTLDTETATVGGTIASGDDLTITFTSTGISGSPVNVSYTTSGSDSATTAATKLAAAINANAALVQAGVSAATTGPEITISYPSTLTISFSETATGSATITLTAGSTTSGSVSGLQLAAKFSGILGNQISIAISAGTVASTFTATIQPFPGFNNGNSEVFANIPASSFWSNLQNAINLGQGVLRGPSNLVVASNAFTGTLAPLTATPLTLSGGTDGRNVTSANLLGTSSASSGFFALSNMNPGVTIGWVAGLTDNTIYESLQAIADSAEFLLLLTFPLGTSVSQAISDVQSYGINDFEVGFVYQWVYFFDSYNQQVRLVPPLAVAAGAMGILPPWSSPSNKPVAGIIGTEQTNQFSPNVPFQLSDLSLLEQNGIMAITKPIVRGPVFGFRNGQNSSSNTQANNVAYTRTTNFILASIDSVLGQFDADEQSNASDDPLRAAVTATLNDFFKNLPQGAVQSSNVICNMTNNTPTTVAQGQLNIAVYAEYYGYALDVVLTYEGGARTNTTSNTLGAGNPVLS